MNTSTQVSTNVTAWFTQHARPLPWRGAAPWGVYVSEIMSHQTPVARVEPVWRTWLDRWPDPAALAREPSGEAVRAWGRLGYPRRALRLHESAVVMTRKHDGQVPDQVEDLLALPGVGAYTAAAVLAFAFGKRAAVLDVNIRRVQARVFTGVALPAASLSTFERELAQQLLPSVDADCVRWNAALMELGALVCTARSPRCQECPLTASCAWFLAGRPAHTGPMPRAQQWHGTDRQVRGRLLAVLREHENAVPAGVLAQTWPDATQRGRCLESLLADGLVTYACATASSEQAGDPDQPYYQLPG